MRRIGQQYALDRAQGRELARDAGWLIGSELRAVGIDLAFAPCVDLDYGISEVIGDRALHADPTTVGTLGVDLMNGLREAGMAATAKHFPGHGAVAADSHVALPVDRRALADLSGDLTPYRRMIINGLTSIMMAHVVFPEVDQLPASLSPRWIGQILRKELDFRGAVFTDDLSMAGAVAFGGVLERATLALEAGADMLLVCNSRSAVLTLLDALPAQSNPVSALRLARVRGRQAEVGLAAVSALHAQARWQRVYAALHQEVRPEPPPLELKG
jgi:beta-N-acetylhexosaminidase